MSAFGDNSHEGRWLDELQAVEPGKQGNAALRLAAIARERGEFDRAQVLLRTVCHQGDPVFAPRAAFALGKLHAEAGNRHPAEMAFNLAAQLSQPLVTPDVHLNLAARWAAHGRTDEAVAAYMAVVDGLNSSSDDEWLREEAAVASFRLGDLFLERGDADSAEKAFRSGLASGDDEVAPRSALALARLLEPGDRSGQVDALLEHTIQLDHPDCSPEAALWLAGRCSSRDEYQRAYDLLNLVVECEHPDYAGEAQRQMDALLGTRFEAYLEEVLEHQFARPAALVDEAQQIAVTRPMDALLESVAGSWSAEKTRDSVERSLRWLDPSDDSSRVKHVRLLKVLGNQAAHHHGSWDIETVDSLSGERRWVAEAKHYRGAHAAPPGHNRQLLTLLALWSYTLRAQQRGGPSMRPYSVRLEALGSTDTHLRRLVARQALLSRSGPDLWAAASHSRKSRLLVVYDNALGGHAPDDFDFDVCPASAGRRGGMSDVNLWTEVAAALAQCGERQTLHATCRRAAADDDAPASLVSDSAALVALGALSGVALAGVLSTVMPALAALARALPDIWRRLAATRQVPMSPPSVGRHLAQVLHTEHLRSWEALDLWADVHQHRSPDDTDIVTEDVPTRELTVVGGGPTVVELGGLFGLSDGATEEDEEDDGPRFAVPYVLLPR